MTIVKLGKTEEALRDVNDALKIAPNSPQLLACRAEIYLGIGKFENSVYDYSRAITLGATGSLAFSEPASLVTMPDDWRKRQW